MGVDDLRLKIGRQRQNVERREEDRETDGIKGVPSDWPDFGPKLMGLSGQRKPKPPRHLCDPSQAIRHECAFPAPWGLSGQTRNGEETQVADRGPK